MVLTISSGFSPVQAATATATLTMNANFSAPPCTVTVPGNIFLGAILPGEKIYPSFTVDVNCTSATRAALYAEPASGEPLISGMTTRIEMSGPAGVAGTPAQFWLNTEGKEIDLTGTGATDTARTFCEGTDSRGCTLTPATQVVMDTPKGQTTATIRIGIMYP